MERVIATADTSAEKTSLHLSLKRLAKAVMDWNGEGEPPEVSQKLAGFINMDKLVENRRKLMRFPDQSTENPGPKLNWGFGIKENRND